MIATSDEELAQAKRHWQTQRAQRAIPASVRFDRLSRRILIEFTNGAAFLVPARTLQGLEDATDEHLAEVELLGETGLHWESLDVDYTISGLMSGVFGNKAWSVSGIDDG